ncbi:MAG: hypothetical protein J5I91_05880 [Bacteroidetes bacterium]|nr:hypothetical protein [Bacteroidota bacterium]
MKNTSALLAFAFFATTVLTLASCGLSNKSLSQYDDMYYSPSEAKKQAILDDKKKKKIEEDYQTNSFSNNNSDISLQNQSNYNPHGNTNGNTIINNYYGTGSRMNYGGYFNRFGVGYYGSYSPMVSYNPYNIGFSFWTGYGTMGYNNYPYYGMGYGYNPYYMYNPYSYNPYYMSPYMGGYDFHNPYYYNYGNNSWGNSGTTITNPNPQTKRENYGTNQSPIKRNRGTASYGTPNNPGTATGSNSSSRSSNRNSSGQTPIYNTPSRSYNQPSSGNSGSSPSYNSPRSSGNNSGSSGNSRSGSSSRGGRR